MVVEKSQPEIDHVAAALRHYLEGKALVFDLEWLDWDRCSIFQSRALRAECAIPRGWVSTYGRIARELGSADAARAVGGALAANPFPLLIPCHRAVRSNGELGGYQGGLEMKKALLEMERRQLQESWLLHMILDLICLISRIEDWTEQI